jgi:hypothetical protein
MGGFGSSYSSVLLEMLKLQFLSLSRNSLPHLLIASQSRSERYGEEMDILSMPGFEIQAVRHVVRWA